MNPEDYGWFTPQDFQLVLKGLSKNQSPASPTVLVGGQAIIAWVLHYKIPIPNTETPALTQDVDFLGSSQVAILLAKEINAEINIATMDDHTPNTAVLSFISPTSGKILIIDFLGQLTGLNEKEVKKLAVPLKFKSLSDVQVMHPILCLKSRFENLHKLKIKRNGNGITQAKIAVDVIKAFLKDTLQQENGLRQALNAIKKIKQIALSNAGLFVYHEYSLDILSAINIDKFEGSKFVTLGWPQLRDEVKRKREKKSNIK